VRARRGGGTESSRMHVLHGSHLLCGRLTHRCSKWRHQQPRCAVLKRQHRRPSATDIAVPLRCLESAAESDLHRTRCVRRDSAIAIAAAARSGSDGSSVAIDRRNGLDRKAEGSWPDKTCDEGAAHAVAAAACAVAAGAAAAAAVDACGRRVHRTVHQIIEHNKRHVRHADVRSADQLAQQGHCRVRKRSGSCRCADAAAPTAAAIAVWWRWSAPWRADAEVGEERDPADVDAGAQAAGVRPVAADVKPCDAALEELDRESKGCEDILPNAKVLQRHPCSHSQLLPSQVRCPCRSDRGECGQCTAGRQCLSLRASPGSLTHNRPLSQARECSSKDTNWTLDVY
jgi:hypothetical protein